MTSNLILANTLGLTPKELAEYRYQSTKTKRAYYAIGDFYYAVGRNVPKDIVGSRWVPCADQFIERNRLD